MESESVAYDDARLSVWTKVTPLSKYLTMTLFVLLPFIGGWVGHKYAPEKVMEVEKVIVKEVVVEKGSVMQESIQETNNREVPKILLWDKSNVNVQCIADSDCMLVQPDCEDCTFVAIATSEHEVFSVEKQNRCELNPPKVMCDIVFNGEVKCIDNSCQTTERN